jgi:hypothetical protein
MTMIPFFFTEVIDNLLAFDLYPVAGVEICFIFAINGCMLCFSCNVKKSQSIAKLY